RAALGVVTVSAISAGGGELTELVSDHGLGDEHRDMLASIVHRDRVPDHLRKDVAATRPGLDDALLARVVELLHLLQQVVVAERALLERSSHAYFVLRRTIMRSVCLLCRVRWPRAGLPHGVWGLPPAPLRPSPPPCGWSNGFMVIPRTAGRKPRHRVLPALPQFWFSWSTLPTWPIVAVQRTSMRRIS